MPSVEDDATIRDDALLWHRVHPNDIHPDESGQPVASSGSLRDKQDGASVHIAELTALDRIHPSFPKHWLLEFSARTVREADCIIMRAPTAEDASHALIMRRANPPTFLTKNQAARIRDGARLYRPEQLLQANQGGVRPGLFSLHRSFSSLRTIVGRYLPRWVSEWWRRRGAR